MRTAAPKGRIARSSYRWTAVISPRPTNRPSLSTAGHGTLSRKTTPTCVGPWRSRCHPDNKGNCRIGQCWSNDRDSKAVQDIRVYGDTAKKQNDKTEDKQTKTLTGEIYAQAIITPESVGRAVGRIGHRRHISIGSGGWHTAGLHDQQQRLG